MLLLLFSFVGVRSMPVVAPVVCACVRWSDIVVDVHHVDGVCWVGSGRTSCDWLAGWLDVVYVPGLCACVCYLNRYLNASVSPTEGHLLPPPSTLRQWELHVESGSKLWHLTTAVQVVVLDADGDLPAVAISVNAAQLRAELGGTLEGVSLDKIEGTYEVVRHGRVAAPRAAGAPPPRLAAPAGVGVGVAAQQQRLPSNI